MKLQNSIIGLCGVAGAFTFSVSAEETQRIKTLREVVVVGQEPILTQPSIETARRRINLVPGGVDVIDA